jgi:imidazole glycerol phosphate synthase subunit HisF
MIESVAKNIEVPLIVGGGITSPEKAYLNCKAGADLIVVGNAIEKDASLIKRWLLQYILCLLKYKFFHSDCLHHLFSTKQ